MVKYTPGPWMWKIEKDEWYADEITAPSRVENGQVPIAKIDTDFKGVIGEEQQWNARLIAAAPELLAALELAKEMFITNDLTLPKTMEVINKAITKAKGEDSKPKPTCQKQRVNEQWHCHQCGTQWDVDDPEPPVCEVEG